MRACATFRWSIRVGLLMAAFVACRHSRAVLVGVEYYDRAVVNPEFAGGPLWTGYVDTAADTLTIETWTELPLHGNEYWIPGELSLVWPARNAQGGRYDVPDTFAGHIDHTFAFISDRTLREMSWLEPDYSPATPTQSPVLLATNPAEFTLSTLEIRPGWGGWAFGPPNATAGQYTFLTRNPFQGDGQQPYDEHMMPVLPVGSQAALASTGATVSISLGATSSVPELSSWMLVAAAAATGSVLTWVHHVRRRMPLFARR
jgi:hypothetical protein